MKRKTALLLTALFLLALCASCGGGSADSAPAAGGGVQEKNAIAAPGAPVPDPAETTAPAGLSTSYESGEAYGGVGAEIYSREDAKLIRRASLSMQSTEFDRAAAALDGLTEACGGYYESVEAQLGGYYAAGSMRRASYTVRVPGERYTEFLGELGDVGHVVSRNESSQDVGAEYRDAELHLKTQQTKQERLLSLMEKADQMEDIIALENALTEVEYQIESLTSTLKTYDALVDYATIQISLEEVAKLTDTPDERAPLAARMGSAFGDGLEGFGTAMGNLAVWMAYHFVGVLLFAAAVAAAVLVLRRKLGWAGKKKQPPSGGDDS